MEIKKVEVYVEIAGDYCAFHEMSFMVVYDVTNDIQLEEYTLNDLKNWTDREYCDCELRDAILVDGTYYVEW